MRKINFLQIREKNFPENLYKSSKENERKKLDGQQIFPSTLNISDKLFGKVQFSEVSINLDKIKA